MEVIIKYWTYLLNALIIFAIFRSNVDHDNFKPILPSGINQLRCTI